MSGRGEVLIRVRAADRTLVDFVRESPVDRARRDYREIAEEIAAALVWAPGALVRTIIGSPEGGSRK